MTANIFGSRFTSRDRPAWWDVGSEHVHHEDRTARQAFEEIGTYEVGLAPVYAEMELGTDLASTTRLELPNRAIIRKPTWDDASTAVFGIVSDEYELVTPQDCVALWDEHVARPVSTMGALRDGRILFVTTELPTIDVKGDPVLNYMGLLSPMTGGDAASVEVFPIRIVCENTFKLAKSMATEVYRVVHDGTAKEKLGAWLTDVYSEAVLKVEVIQEALNLLADHMVTEDETDRVLVETYPDPKAPRRDAPESVMRVREEGWVKGRENMARRREGARGLFLGDGTGMDLPATKGTAYGLYNAITEVEDWRRASRDVNSVTENLLIGPRADVKQRAFESLMAVAG